MKERGEPHSALAMRVAIDTLFAACLGVAVSVGAIAQSSTQARATEWKLSTALGPAYPQGRAGVIWAELIREQSGGRLNAKTFPGATLVQRDAAREFAALRDGAIDLAVAPKVAVFTPGYRNRFGHPRPEIVARYADAGVRTYRTDYEGALTFAFAPGSTLAPLSERDVDRRYWRDVPLRGELAPLE